jgi:hypothetical protein
MIEEKPRRIEHRFASSGRFALSCVRLARQAVPSRYYIHVPNKTQVLAVNPSPVLIASIERRIHLIRGRKVMLDADLAELYRVPTSRLNEQVKRNRKRFPADFMFQLTVREEDFLTSQNAISNAGRGGRRTLPYAFTEQGVAMLSSVLKSEPSKSTSLSCAPLSNSGK